MAPPLEQPPGRITKVVVATSVMPTFISFWRAAAMVLHDLGSSAYGYETPWLIRCPPRNS